MAQNPGLPWQMCNLRAQSHMCGDSGLGTNPVHSLKKRHQNETNHSALLF